jgi:MFS family permease
VNAPVAVEARGYYRWVICALLFFSATVNYIDRQVLGILKPTLQGQFSWSERDYAAIVFSFQLAYAIGLLLAGGVIDKLGTRLGFALAVVLWSIAAVAHAIADWAPGLRLPTPLIDPPSIVMLSGARRASPSRASCSGWAKPATSPLRSRPSPSGSPRRSGRSRPASSIRAPTSARWSRRWSCRG